jgi:hypothetical protein
MENAAREAYEYYHGLRYEAMEADHFRYLPRYDAQKKDWVVIDPQHSSPALDTTMRYALALKVGNKDLQKELSGVHQLHLRRLHQHQLLPRSLRRESRRWLLLMRKNLKRSLGGLVPTITSCSTTCSRTTTPT